MNAKMVAQAASEQNPEKPLSDSKISIKQQALRRSVAFNKYATLLKARAGCQTGNLALPTAASATGWAAVKTKKPLPRKGRAIPALFHMKHRV